MSIRIIGSINRSVLNKERSPGFNARFETRELTLPEMVAAIGQGHAISADFGGRERKKSNFVRIGYLALDFDSGYTLKDALLDPWIQDYACLIYTSASHDPIAGVEKFRVIWAMSQAIESASDVETAIRNLMNRYPNADPACKDASRMYYGNTSAQFPLTQEALYRTTSS